MYAARDARRRPRRRKKAGIPEKADYREEAPPRRASHAAALRQRVGYSVPGPATLPPCAREWATPRRGSRQSGGRGIFFHLLEVPLLDLLHHGFTAKQIFFELRGDLAWHNEELVSDHFRKGNWAARG